MLKEKKLLFELGKQVMTKGIKFLIEEGRFSYEELFSLIERHVTGDWSEMDKADQKENQFSINKNLRIFSAYTMRSVKFWVITEADRSSTCILLPEEY